MKYTELHCLSNFSFLRSASHPEELVETAAKLGYQAIAITDECSFSGLARAHVKAKEFNIKLIVGSEFHLDDLHLILLCPDRAAYGQLCQLITTARRRSPKGQYQLTREDLSKGLDRCLCLWLPHHHGTTDAAWLKTRFPNRLWLAGNRNLERADRVIYQSKKRLAKVLQLPFVCVGSVMMHQHQRKPLLDVLTCIKHSARLQDAGFLLKQNGEAFLQPIANIKHRYGAEEITQTQIINQLCHFSLDELKYEYPQDLVPAGQTAYQYLLGLVKKGEKKRFPLGTPKDISRLIDKELALIKELSYEHYFLTIEDIVRFARCQQILCQGRGSAANSVVCYCLFITEVDPTQVNLLFERFISKERNEPPDIDVDFENARREEVIQYIYQKYGRQRAALAATVITYRAKSAIRDTGKALGLDLHHLEQLISTTDWRDREKGLEEKIADSGLFSGHTAMCFSQLVTQLKGFPRHLSQHVGGFVIANHTLAELVPVENAAMADRTVIQWDKDDLESLGLMKVDILALGMLTAIRKTFDYIQAYRQKPLSLSLVPKADPAVYKMLQKGDSIGVFQVESRAQINMLPRLKPANYYDLVIQVAIVRPGPIQGDMVHPYIRRRNKQETVDYPNAAVKAVLERTLGVPIFQEQVIKLAMVAAGFSAGEADQLRRAMASWKSHGKLDFFEDKLVTGMLKNGHHREFAQRVFNQIKGFGEYGFPESHAASFAHLVYVSAWLKYHEPAAFYCGLLNSQPMGFYSPSQLIQDVKRQGVTVLPVDINHSDWDHKLEKQADPALRLGLRLVKGANKQELLKLLKNRPDKGFTQLDELTNELGKTTLEALASSDALVPLAGHRFQARWDMAGVEPQLPLFAGESPPPSYTQLKAPEEGENLLEDYASLGLTLHRHPLTLLREQGKLSPCSSAKDLLDIAHGTVVTVAGLVVGRQRPGSGAEVTFVTLEDETGNINVVVWKATAKAQQQVLLTAKLLKVKGIIEREGDIIHIIAGKLINLTTQLNGLLVSSRDFH